jgi:dipeptidase
VCDTLATITADGVLFAKNSDRDANESQVLEWHPGAQHAAGTTVRCTWIEVPQAAATRAVVLSRPWWMWGAEMGANDRGVVIGNEAVFTKVKPGDPALTGMDLVRLALERAGSATDAASVIVDLLERHGQGGPCSHERPGFTYDNSFLIADADGAVVLETAGRNWADEVVSHGARSISNGLTIPGFADRFADAFRGRMSACAVRRARTQAAAEQASGPADLMAALRDHGGGPGPHWSVLQGTLRAPCVHAGGVVAATSSQTTASMVSDLRSAPLHWMTATAAPCTSLFKPVRVDEPEDLGAAPTNRFDPGTIWWRHELLHRTALRDLPAALSRFGAERDAVEAKWLASPPSTQDAFVEAARLEAKWLARVSSGAADRRPVWVRPSWRRLEVAAGIGDRPAAGP